jgi:hypothetical protein
LAVSNIQQLASKIGEIQLRSLDAISDTIENTESDYIKEQLNDMSEVIRLDLSCRISLEIVGAVIPKVEVTGETYDEFVNGANTVISFINNLDIPEEAVEALDIVKKEMESGRRLPLSDIFTVASVLVTTVSLVAQQMEIERLYLTIKKLDKLLEIKTQQLELLKQFAKYHGDFVS